MLEQAPLPLVTEWKQHYEFDLQPLLWLLWASEECVLISTRSLLVVLANWKYLYFLMFYMYNTHIAAQRDVCRVYVCVFFRFDI